MIPFAKAHACGNDFLIVDMQHTSGLALPGLTQRLCARNTGVGADGVEYLTWISETSARIQLHNADGSVAEISGNGTRCVAAYMTLQVRGDNRAKPGDSLTIETDAGERKCHVLEVHENGFIIASAMGVPTVDADAIILKDGRELAGAIVSIGNPHFVIFTEDNNFSVLGRSWQEVGNEICHHSRFPQQTNVEFVRVVSPREIEIRIFERGVGPTSSSGTGICAAAAAAILLRRGERRLNVVAPGGAQQIDWPAADAQIVLTGPAQIVCFGEAF